MYKQLLRPLVFKLDPEKAHYLTFDLMKLALGNPFGRFMSKSILEYKHPKLKRQLFGLNFENPVGLAAGLDKDAKVFNELGALGFGFIEIGTLTPKPQPGNDKPRLFRLPNDKAIINRMGFNNEGVDAAVIRLKNRKTKAIIGGNIGKNKVTSNEDAIKDYEYCFNALFDVVDYFVVNVSSPNTPNLRELQDKEPLTHLLNHLQNINNSKPKRKPLLLKIAPDLTNSQLDDIIDIVASTKIDGIVATNTTIAREPLTYPKAEIEAIGMGGLSGKPLTKRSTEVIAYLKTKSNNAFPVIGVGGIHSPEDAIEKIKAGADLIQLYTGFIYEGPALIKNINKELIKQNIL
ncbi:MAG: quinone-dependent dihydroorotate dehydrogenase [Bacteroidetes bacterium]|jgi:dihydroorotate dehydrogenase|nr:quinone-dependent dihydroorotate dehydrogenase [Bacteroidota bacterium]